MINNINSNLNYNYINNTNNLNSKKNTQKNNLNNNTNNTKELNLNNNNIGNNKTNNNINTSLNNNNILNPIQNKTSNSVSDKSEATNKILGYGVDKDGFFTSDFNEAAGIPKDYKIFAKGAENFVNEYSQRVNNTFINIDFAKTIGNAYKLFSQLAPNTNSNSFTQEQLQNMPVAFVYDVNTLEITKTFNQDEAKDFYNTMLPYVNENHNATQTYLNKDFINPKINDIFYSVKADIGQSVYTNSDGSISKGGALMAFLNARLYQANDSILVGDVTIQGKLLGLDKTMSKSEIEDLQNFIKDNPISYGITGDIATDFINMIKLKSSNTDVEKFKKEWLEMKAKSDAMGEKYKVEIANSKNILFDENTDNKEKENKLKPIKGESQNKETYQNKDTNDLLKKLLENKFNLSKELEILFGVKIDDKDINNNDFAKIFSKLNLHNIKSVDLKA